MGKSLPSILLAAGGPIFWIGLPMILPNAPYIGAIAISAALSIWALAAYLLMVQKGWVNPRFAPGFLCGVAAATVIGFFFSLLPPTDTSTPSPSVLLPFPDIQTPPPQADGRYSLAIRILNPVDIRSPKLEIENLIDIPVTYTVELFGVSVNTIRVIREMRDKNVLQPDALQRITPKTIVDTSFVKDIKIISVIYLDLKYDWKDGASISTSYYFQCETPSPDISAYCPRTAANETVLSR